MKNCPSCNGEFAHGACVACGWPKSEGGFGLGPVALLAGVLGGGSDA